eukprot:7096296-Pyramimonas_sp.AAC.1
MWGPARAVRHPVPSRGPHPPYSGSQMAGWEPERPQGLHDLGSVVDHQRHCVAGVGVAHLSLSAHDWA